jgi:predicted phosphohydrolase
MKLIWVSDIHLNFLSKTEREQFYYKLKKSKGDYIVISGDIAESHNVVELVREMEDAVSVPVYFVLGNHDFYGSSVASVKRSVKSMGYLGSKQIVALDAYTALVGVDGWGDCRYGDFENSRLVMNDWFYIKDLKYPYYEGTLKEKLQELADKDARALKRKVMKAIKEGYSKIIIVTHVPPFEECCLHAGRKSTPSGLPFYASKIIGETILPLAKKHSNIDFLWLSGHTHSRASFQTYVNMTCKVAQAEYHRPQIEEVIDL